MMKRGPRLSMSRPMNGLTAADTRMPKENAPAARPRSQPNSSTIGGNIREKAVRAVTPSATVTKAMAMITQPKKKGSRAANELGVPVCSDILVVVSPAALWDFNLLAARVRVNDAAGSRTAGRGRDLNA